jgi:hypothetical protein
MQYDIRFHRQAIAHIGRLKDEISKAKTWKWKKGMNQAKIHCRWFVLARVSGGALFDGFHFHILNLAPFGQNVFQINSRDKCFLSTL